MENFIWHSTGNFESAEVLYDYLGDCDIGKVPPKDFSGVGICLGAKPADIFKWENRKFRALLNDPRIIRPLAQDKYSLFQRLSNGSVLTETVCMASSTSGFSSIIEMVGPEYEYFYCCTPSARKPTKVSNQNELMDAVNAGLTLAVGATAVENEECTVLVVDGKPSVYTNVSNDTDAILKDLSTVEGSLNQEVLTFLEGMVKSKGKLALTSAARIQQEADIDSLPSSVIAGIQLITACLGEDAQMYRVHFSKSGDNYLVSNIVFSPSFTDLSDEAMKKVADNLDCWVASNSKTHKNSLLDMVQEASEDDAEAMIEALKSFANG